jgi:hypothetical protein
MKAITVSQPWAWLLAAGIKTHETRSWATNQCGMFVIHASKRTKFSDEAFDDLFYELPELFTEHGVTEPDDLAYGSAVGTATLVACHRTERRITGVSLQETDLGDWTPGRFAWEFTGAYLLPEPIPYRGQQGIWEFPETVLYGVKTA